MHSYGDSQKTTSVFRCALLRVFWEPPYECTHFKNVRFGQFNVVSPRARRVLPRLGTPARLLPRDVRDELRSKFGCHRPNIERMVRPIRFGGSIERMVYDEFWGCGRADCGLSCSPATRCGLRGRGPHSNRYRAGKGRRRKAAAGEGAISRHADVGVQCTQRHSGRSRTGGPLCKWTFLCTRRSSEIEAIKG